MTQLSWKLSTAPAQPPDAWLLFVDSRGDGVSLEQLAPYVGVGSYSVDLAQATSGFPLTDGVAHTYSVALVTFAKPAVIGPKSAPISVTLPAVSQAPAPVTPSLPGLPAADSVVSI